MEHYQRQQFDFLLFTAVERYSERLIQHNMGAGNALVRLRQDANAAGVRRDAFVDALFSEFLLDNAAGACFVLQALSSQVMSVPMRENQSIGDLLIQMAKTVFAQLMQQKTEELLEQSTLFEESIL